MRKRRRYAIMAFAALIVIVLLVLVVISYSGDIRLAHERVSAGSRIVLTSHGPVECAVIGDGPPVLIAHGAGGGFDQGLDFGAALARDGFRVIAMSRFGYLRTPLPADGSPAAQADTYAALLDALGVRRAAVVGLSAGAPSCMQFALRHPDRTSALVLLVPAAYPSHQQKRSAGAMPGGASGPAGLLFDAVLKSDFLFWAATRLARRALMPLLLGTPPQVVDHAERSERARVAEVRDHLLPFSLRRRGVMNDAAFTPFLPRYDLEGIAVPTLVIGTADDVYGTYDGARYSAVHIRGATFVGYETGGHLLVGHLQDALSEICAFLSRLD